MAKIVVGAAAFDPVGLAGFGGVQQMRGAVEDAQVGGVQIGSQPAGFDNGVWVAVHRDISLSFFGWVANCYGTRRWDQGDKIRQKIL